MRAVFLGALAAAVAGCAGPSPRAEGPAQSSSPAPSYLTVPNGCAVVAGGGIGSSFSDPKVSVFWQKVNAEITDQVYEHLASDGYHVVKLIVPSEQAADNQRIVVRTLGQSRCSRLIQISHTVGEDPSGKFFSFDVTAMRMQPKGDRAAGASGTNVVTVGEFQRNYRYPRSTESFNTFRTSVFAAAVYGDLRQSAVLEPLR